MINRVTAASMEPRGAIGDYNPAEDRYTIYTTLQRTHGYRAELARQVLKVPESRVRVVAGDIGGSFGMKSAIYNEVALVLLASKTVGRPVKWTSTRSEAFLGDAQARDNVTEAELALDRDGHFLGLRVRTIAAVGAYPQAGSNAFVANLGTLAGVYRTPAMRAEVTAVYTNTNPVRPYRGNGRPEAAYVIERMVDEAAAEIGIDAIELRRRNMIPPEAMPFKSGLTFTYDCGEFEKNLDLALKLADAAGFEQRRAEAPRPRQIARPRPLQHDRARRGGRVRGGRDPLRPRRHRDPGVGLDHPGPGPRDGLQAVAVRPARHPPRSGALRPGRHRQGRDRRRHRRLALGGARRVGGLSRDREDRDQGQGDRRPPARRRGRPRSNFADGLFTAPRSNRALTIGEIATESFNPPSLPDDMEPGLIAGATFTSKQQNFPNGVHICELEIDPDTGEVEILRYSVVDDVGTVMNPLLLEGQICGGIAQGVGQVLMEDIRFDPASGQLLTGSFMDYAMPRADDLSAIECESNPVPTKTNPLGVKGAGEAGNVGAMPAVGNALDRRALPARHPPRRNARHPRAPVARDPRRAGRVTIPVGDPKHRYR